MTAEVLPIRRGRPAKGEVIRIGLRIQRDAEREAWRNVRAHAGHIHLAVRADRPDLALHKAGEIVSLADRRLRQLGDTDDVA